MRGAAWPKTKMSGREVMISFYLLAGFYGNKEGGL